MDAVANKQLMMQVFAELAQGNGAPFRDCLADDIVWIFKGSTKWTGSYHGKHAVLNELLAPIFAQFAGTYCSRPARFLADGEFVVIETQGNAVTTAGARYDNHYCYVCRLSNGKVVELTEYMDTALADAVLAGPG